MCVMGYACHICGTVYMSESFYDEEAITLSLLSQQQSGLYIAAKSVPYLTVATLTSVAFLRSSKMRKLPA